MDTETSIKNEFQTPFVTQDKGSFCTSLVVVSTPVSVRVFIGRACSCAERL